MSALPSSSVLIWPIELALTTTAGPGASSATPPLPGDGSGATPGTTAPGGPTAAADPFGGSMIFVIGAVFIGIIAMSMFGQRKEKKRREALLGAIKKHDEVQTVGGVIGSVVEIKSDRVVLKVDESSNTRMTFARSAVQQVLGGDAAEKIDA